MDVVLYSTGCPKCKVLKNKLMQNGINFIENNDKNEMLKNGFKNVPMLKTDTGLLDFYGATQWVNGVNSSNF